MWRSSLTLAARPIRHFRQFKIRRNQWNAPPKEVERPTFKPNVAKNLVFAAGSSCLFVTGATIHLYEKRADQIEAAKEKDRDPNQRPRPNPWKEWWTSIPSHKKTFAIICSVNAFIYCLWRIPSLSPFMTKFFARSPMSTRVTPMLLSVFSHNSLAPLAFNMLALSLVIRPVAAIFGDTNTLVLYLTYGVCSSVASHFMKCFLKIPTMSMGAGGAVFGMWTLISLISPGGGFSIKISLFPPLSISWKNGVEACVLVDILGIITKSRSMDHTARLAGVLVSIMYIHVGSKLQNWYTKRFWKLWHRLRQRG